VDISAHHDRSACLVDGDVLNWARSTQTLALASAVTFGAARGSDDEPDLELRL
jgi:hypothetical protein